MRDKRAAAAVVAALLAAAPSRAAGPPTEPALVAVPEALRARVPMLELSGLAWAPSLDRYLVVVDDTVDLDEGVRHAPFVLALDRAGRLDPEPVPITGVDEVNDAEALAAGPAQTFYLLTSHSLNRRGRSKASRRQLLRLKLEGRQLQVTAGLDLVHGHGDVREQLEAMGVPSASVDLEGLAYRDGALYIGVKEPLGPDGSALIMKLDRADDVFTHGKLRKQSLSVWAQVKLVVEAVGQGPPPRGVFEGIADMFFAPDGTLYLCANAPKGGTKDGGGALWRVAAPREGQLEAQLARRFPRLKPEGVTAAPDGHALTLVFDRDLRDPLWTSWPLAARPALTREGP